MKSSFNNLCFHFYIHSRGRSFPLKKRGGVYSKGAFIKKYEKIRGRLFEGGVFSRQGVYSKQYGIKKKNENIRVKKHKRNKNIYEHTFPIFLKIFVELFPDYMKPFHHKYARLLGSDDFYSCLRLLHQLYKQTSFKQDKRVFQQRTYMSVFL